MEQKDFILREIEKIGLLLQYLIGKIVPSKTIQEQQTTEELINKELKEKYGHDLDFILKVPKSDFEKEFSKNKGFSFENIELLADLLFTIGKDNKEKNMRYFEKAFELYNYIDIKTKTFSFARRNKINSIKSFL